MCIHTTISVLEGTLEVVLLIYGLISPSPLIFNSTTQKSKQWKQDSFLFESLNVPEGNTLLVVYMSDVLIAYLFVFM